MPTCRGAGSAFFTMCYVDAHAAIMESTCTELAWGPWVTGGVVMTVRPNGSEKQRGTVLGSETIFLVSCHMAYKPPQADNPEA